MHPLTQTKKRVEEIFQTMGFSIVEGLEMETEWYNFDALNIPEEHPARDVLSLGKTFYLKRIKARVMRTQTSSVQVRYMKKHSPPFRIISIGKVFRAEATDASHETNFYQIEGLMIGKDVSVANFRAIIEQFFKSFFEKPAVIRLRPGYFPFVEPGFEVDMSCAVCSAKGCSACKHSGWVELLGAGMVHPNVLKNAGLIPHYFGKKDNKEIKFNTNDKNSLQSEGGWQGFAFGMSLDRLVMMKHKINDIRLFHSGDLRFLEQF